MATIIQRRRDTAANWTSNNPILADGEFGFETDTKKSKIGDGATSWTSLTYVINPRLTTIASSATPTPAGDTSDMFTVTALAVGATFAAPTGTPTDGQPLLIRIKDDGTSRTLTWNAIYRAGTDFALPAATVISETIYIQFIYNSADSKWDAVGLTQGL